MNVEQRPRTREFCATMRDYIIDTDSAITFAVQYGGKTILEEEYVPDGNYKVRTRGLGKFCELALWGVWCDGEVIRQAASCGWFTFLINGAVDMTMFVMFSRLQTRKDAVTPGCLSEVQQKVTYPGMKEYVSGPPMTNGSNKGAKVIAYWSDGTEADRSLVAVSTIGILDAIYTFDVSPERVFSLFEKPDIVRYRVSVDGGSILFHVNRAGFPEVWCFRYKNVYDMPETLAATGGMKLAGNNESDTAAMYGVDRKFGVKVTDEYTVNSGSVLYQSDYKLWHNLLNAQEASILVRGEWLPIVVTKQKFEREFRRSVLKAVEFSFRLADPEQNNLIEYD